MIIGETVVLYERTASGRDAFNKTTYTETPVSIDNVLIAPASTDDIPETTALDAKKAVYTLAIPKGDTHVWEDRIVEFWGQKWRTFAFSTQGIEANIPLLWNRKVQVERYG